MSIPSMPRRARRRHLRRLGLFVPFFVLASAASATDLYWKNPVSGLWGVGTNWTDVWSGNPYVPGAGDRAFIGGAGDALNAWTVTFDTNVSVDALFSRAALNLAGRSLTLANASTVGGDLDLKGASLLGAGTLAASGATTLSGTTLGAGGTLTLTGSVTLAGAKSTFDRDVITTGTTVWHSDGGANAGWIAGAGTYTNTGTLNIDAGGFAGVYVETSFVNSGTVTGAGGATFAGAHFTNSGALSNGGPDINVNSGTFSNSGLLDIKNAGLNVNSTTASNAGGTIRMDGGIAQLAGNWKTAELGSLEAINGGQILFGGTLDNAGATLDLLTSGITRFGGNAWGGPNLGTVVGGTVTHSTSLPAFSNVVFDGAALDGGLDVRGAAVTLKNGSTLGTENVRLTTGTLTFADAITNYNGSIAVYGEFGNSSSVNAGSLNLGPQAVVSTDPNPTFGYSALIFTLTGDLTNQGTILSNNSGIITFDALSGTFRNQGAINAPGPSAYPSPAIGVRAANFVNQGTITLANGAYATLVGSNTFDNSSGTISLTGSSLDFGGDTTKAGLGTITATGGSNLRYVSGTLDLGGGTLDTLGFGAGSTFELAGGTLKGGSVLHSTDIGNGFGGLDGVTLDAAPTFRGLFKISNGLNFPGSTMTLAGGGVTFAGNQSFGGTLTGGGVLGFSSGTFTQLAGGLIESTSYITPSLDEAASGGNVDLAGTSRATNSHYLIANANDITTRATGLITADGRGSMLELSGVNITHGGTLQATDGAIAALVGTGTWSSTGSVTADGVGSEARFGGNTTLAQLGTLTATNGGRIRYAAGTLDLGGETFGLGSVGAPGAFRLYGGTIANGAITGTSSFLRNGYGGLTNVTLDTDLDLRTFNLTLAGSLSTPTGALHLDNSTVKAGDFAPTSVDVSGFGSIDTSGTLSLSGPTTLQSYASLSLTGTVVNSGAISVDAGRLFSNGPIAFTNSGTIHATNGGSVDFSTVGPIVNSGALLADGGATLRLDMTTGWQNSGTVTASGAGSTVEAFGQTDHATLARTTLLDGARLNLKGSVAAPGTTFDLASFGPAGSFGIVDGQLEVATLANSDRLAAESRMTLIGDRTTFDKGLRLNAGVVNAYGVVDLNGSALNLSGYSQLFVGGLGHIGSVTMDNSTVSTSTLDLATGANVSLKNQSSFFGIQNSASPVHVGTMTLDHGSFGASPLTVDRLDVTGGGEFENLVSGSQMNLGRLSVANGAGVRLLTEQYLTGHARLNGDASIDGTVTSSILDAFGGTVSGNGHVQSLSLHGATLAPGHSTGAISVDAFTMDTASRFMLEIGGDASSNLFDQLTSYTTTLDGTLNLSVVNGYVPTEGTWRFLTASSSLTGTFAFKNLGAGWSYGQDAHGAFVRYAPVPEPATLAALGLGLAAFARRRRK